MKALAGISLVSMAVVLSGCGVSEPALVGSMSERSICQTSGYLVRQSLSDKYRTAGIDCTVVREGSAGVLIEAGYKTPNNITLRYAAQGTVNDDTLRLEAIKVHGVDDDFIPFREFGL